MNCIITRENLVLLIVILKTVMVKESKVKSYYWKKLILFVTTFRPRSLILTLYMLILNHYLRAMLSKTVSNKCLLYILTLSDTNLRWFLVNAKFRGILLMIVIIISFHFTYGFHCIFSLKNGNIQSSPLITTVHFTYWILLWKLSWNPLVLSSYCTCNFSSFTNLSIIFFNCDSQLASIWVNLASNLASKSSSNVSPFAKGLFDASYLDSIILVFTMSSTHKALFRKSSDTNL